MKTGKIEPKRRSSPANLSNDKSGTNGTANVKQAASRQLPGVSRRVPTTWSLGLLCLLLALPLALAALWPRAAFALDVGAPGDRLFLENVHGDERTAEYTYRWTGRREEPASLAVPGWGAVRTARLTMRVQGLPGQEAIDLHIRSGGETIAMVRVGEAVATESVVVALPAGTVGAFTLNLDAPARRVSGDNRPLAFKIDSVRLEPIERSGGVFWRTVWRELGLALAIIAALLLALGVTSGRLALIGRIGATLGVPLALAGALPWALALGPYALALASALAALRWWRSLLHWLAAGWVALDDSRVANWTVTVGIALYAVIMLPHLLAVPWINHADYADNAVVARNLVRGNGFVTDYVAQFYNAWATLRHPAETWPPLQPILIAAAFALFGVSVGVAKLPNLLVMIGMLWLIYRIGRWLWSPRVGVIAALLVAIQPDFFEGVIYPLNDTVFTLLALGVIALFVFLAEEREGVEAGGWRGWLVSRPGRAWVLLGALGGLLLLAKPSGAILLAGGGAWVLWTAWRGGRLRPVLIGGIVAAGVALAVYAPWLARNQITFGQPFYSTESYDAFLLEYRDWETIYQVYTGDRPLPHRSLLVGYGLDAVQDKIGAQFRKSWNDLRQGRIIPLLLLGPMVLGALVARERRQRDALAVLAAAVGAYVLFVFVYWHYERRYAFFLIPWGALFGAAGLWWLHDRVSEARSRALAGLATLVLLGAILVPQWGAVRDDWSASLRTPNSVVVASWIRDNTPGGAVVMTRNPWELSFHSERLSVMIPADDLATIRAIGTKYGATHLQLDHLTDPKLRRPALGPLYDGPDEWQGFRKVFDRRDENGEGLLVYEFPR